MTRYARAGKGSTHNRVRASHENPTSWDELKPPPPQRLRGATEEKGDRSSTKKFNKKERFNKGKMSNQKNKFRKASQPHSELSANLEPLGEKSSKSKNSNIRGFGQSRSVKIFGQFWVPVEDAKRLKTLLGKLRAQGLPRKEIMEALKNDRRKAEKAAKRQRDKTCFQCRQFGHILTDCPNLKKASSLTENEEDVVEAMNSEQGLVCFKCGSTEHTSRKCRKSGENFQFANCFICSGTGHIARQCPKNENGIYPSGGSCGECGSTGHLKADCPDLIGVDGSQVDDPEAVTLRMSDPFSSTEYEPIQDLGKDDPVKDDDQQTETLTTKKSSTASFTKTRPNNKKAKRKVDDDDNVPYEFDFGIDAAAPKQNTAPKKRKIVKF